MMPYTMRKLPSGKVRVSMPGGVKSKGSTPANAQKQVNLLRGVEHGWTPSFAGRPHNKNALAKRMGAAIIALFVLLPLFAWGQTAALSRTDITVTSAATLVAATNAARYSLSCTNNNPSVHVRWGDSTVTATKGQRLSALASVEIRSIGPVYMISEGADVVVSCTEETR